MPKMLELIFIFVAIGLGLTICYHLLLSIDDLLDGNELRAKIKSDLALITSKQRDMLMKIVKSLPFTQKKKR